MQSITQCATQCPFGFNCTKKNAGCNAEHLAVCSWYLEGKCAEAGAGCSHGEHPTKVGDKWETADGVVFSYVGRPVKENMKPGDRDKLDDRTKPRDVGTKYDRDARHDTRDARGKNGKKLPPYKLKQLDEERRAAKNGRGAGRGSEYYRGPEQQGRSSDYQRMYHEHKLTEMQQSPMQSNAVPARPMSAQQSPAATPTSDATTAIQSAVTAAIAGDSTALVAQKKIITEQIQELSKRLALIDKCMMMLTAVDKQASQAIDTK